MRLFDPYFKVLSYNVVTSTVAILESVGVQYKNSQCARLTIFL